MWIERKRYNRFYDLHSWSGIVLGWFIYLVAFSGCFALFHHELSTWEDPPARLTIATEPVAIHDHFSAWVDKLDSKGELGLLRLDYPNSHQPYFAGLAFVTPEGQTGQFERMRWSTNNGEPITVGSDALSTWLYDFHRDLMWPDRLGGRTVGLIIVAIAGMVLMLSIISGVLAHTKPIKDLFTLRLRRSVRLRWHDTHKTFGLWGLPFFAVIALTGAILGLMRILFGLAALVAYDGNVAELTQDLAPERGQQAAGIAAPMVSLDTLRVQPHPKFGSAPLRVQIIHWGDQNGIYQIFYPSSGQLKTDQRMLVSAYSGELLSDFNQASTGPTARVYAAVSGLHYGTYGGIALKALYFALGLILAVVIAMGLMMWTERRLHGGIGNRSERFYRVLSRLTIGITLGLPLAVIVSFHAALLLPLAADSPPSAIGKIYFLALATAIFYALLRRNDYRCTIELLAGVGALCLLLPLTNCLMTGDLFITDLFAPVNAYAWVDASAVVLGIALMLVAIKLPRQRPVRNARSRAEVLNSELSKTSA